MDFSSILSAFGLAASAGLNAYIPLLVVSLLAKFTNLITLAKPWDALESWWIIGLLLVLTIIEFISDKIPAVNHVNDAIMTFIRPAAGAIVFAATTSNSKIEVNPILAIAMGILIAGSIHTVKSAVVRPAVTVTTGTAGNVPVSMAEDGVSSVLSVVSAVWPWIVIPVFFVFVILLILLIRFLVKRSEKKKLEKQKRQAQAVQNRETAQIIKKVPRSRNLEVGYSYT